jgi:DNA repair protein RecO (recombination protein O)
MVEKSTGLILRTRRLTETSLIVHWLTAEFGRLATVAKGACRPKSPFRGKLDLFYLANFSFTPSRRSELHTLGEVNLLETHPLMRQDLAYLQQASYCVRLIEQTTETDTPLESIFGLLRDFLGWLPTHPPQAVNVFAFELKILAELGLQPDFTKARLSRENVGTLQGFSEADWPRIAEAHLTSSDTAEIDRYLHGFLIYHLGKLAVGREAAIGRSPTSRPWAAALERP